MDGFQWALVLADHCAYANMELYFRIKDYKMITKKKITKKNHESQGIFLRLYFLSLSGNILSAVWIWYFENTS